MNIHKAHRNQTKIRMALQGPSGAGKTWSALLLAEGLSGDLGSVCVIDTENGSSNLYAHLGNYSVIKLVPPFEPEKYIKAIKLAKDGGFKVIIADSISHAWEYLIDLHAGMAGNSFSNWSKITPRQNALIQTLLTCDAHVISTLRVKQDYVLSDKGNGKMIPEKVGLKAIQRDGVDYEFTLVFELDIRHYARATKDRTGIFMDKPEFIISEDSGKQIREWCSEAALNVEEKIREVKTLKELLELYKPEYEQNKAIMQAFADRKKLFQSPVNFSNNGTRNS